MLKGKTKSGFSYEITDEALDNFELLEAVSEVDENPLALPKVIKLLLGNDQKKKLFDHCRSDKGVVTNEAISAEIMDIFQGEEKIKNS